MVSAVLLGSSTARAARYDLDLTRLGFEGNTLAPRASDFRSLSSELGTLMAPQPMDPADSLGLSGFALSADFTVNTLGANRPYWRDVTDGEAQNVAGTMQIVGRKGLWPGLEVGAGAVHLFDSRLWSMGGYLKAALHEGFHHLPIPSIAVRVGFARLLGAKDFNLTTAAPAVTLSHVFGVGKTVSLTPYVGYEALIILSRSTVLDATPNCDEFGDAYNETCPGVDPETAPEFVFESAGPILRHRPHLGMRMMFSVIRLGFEAMIVPGGTVDGAQNGEAVPDTSTFQQQYTFSVGLDF